MVRDRMGESVAGWVSNGAAGLFRGTQASRRHTETDIGGGG